MASDAGTLTVTYPAEPESVAGARHALADFAASAGADREQIDAVALASSEAVTNAVVHAYRGEPGSVYVTAAVVADELWVLIGDDGCGLEPGSDRPGLGLGLALIAQVSDEMAIAPRGAGGVELRMRFALARTAPARAARVAGGGRARAARSPRPSELSSDAWLPCHPRPRGRARRPA